MEKVEYKSTGLVYGNCWGGGRGAYKARCLKADTKEKLIEEAKRGLDGSLDSGMGYESLIGAMLEICKITIIEIDGREFVNKEYDIETVGNLTEDEEEFLLQNLDQSW